MKRKKLLSTLMALFMILTNVLNPQLIQTIFADENEPDTEDVEEKEEGEDVEVHDLNDDEDSDSDDDVEQTNPESDDDGNQEDNESDDAEDKGTEDEEEKDNKDPPAEEDDDNVDDDENEEDTDKENEDIEIFADEPENESQTHQGVDSDFFDLKISEITDLNGNKYDEKNPLKPDDEFWIKAEWELENGHEYKEGDSVDFQLPKELTIQEGFDGELKYESGNVVAAYVVSQNGEVKLTFTDFVEENSNVKGWLEIRAELDKSEVQEENGKIVIGPIGEEGSQTLPIDRGPKNKTVEKQGKPNKSYNADEIEWTVTINKTATSFNDVNLTDLLPAGTEYKEGSLKVVKQGATLNGTPVGDKTEVSVTPSVTDGELSVPLGDIDEVYTLTYTTTVTDEDAKNFKNKVTFKDDNLEPTEAEATVTINRGEPLAKGTVKNYDPKTGIIEWYLDINFNQKDLTNETLTDSWADSQAAGKMALVDDSVRFQEMEIDENGNASTVGEEGDASVVGGTVIKETDGFKITGITTDKAYRITYQTKATDRHLTGFNINNKAEFNDVTKTGNTFIDQYIGVKTAGSVNYAEKTIEWTIRVNRDHAKMKNVVITDWLGAGLTLIEDSFEVNHDYTLNDKDQNPFKIELGDIEEEVVITYKTNYDADAVLPGQLAKNKIDIDWEDTEGEEFTKGDLQAEKQLNEGTVKSSWKNASYNPDTKEITWTIIANYRENAYDDFHIVDTPQGNQKLIEDSIRVVKMKVNANGDHVDVGQINPDIAIDGNAFDVQIGQTDKAYKVVYKTSVAGLEDIAQKYKNKASVKDGDKVIADIEASAQVYGDRKYGNKRGQQDGRKVDWSIDVNLAQEKIANLQLVDTISDNQAYIEDTITVYHAKLNSGGTLSKGEAVDKSEYELVVDETEFTVKWKNTIERPYIVDYSTLFFAGDAEQVRNDYKITGDGISENDSDASDGYNVTIRQTSGGGAEGTAGYLLVHKIDTTYGQAKQAISGIKFELIDPSNGKPLKTVTTDNDGYADFGRLLYGTYELKEVNVPDGYIAPNEVQEVTIDEEFIVGESDKLNYKLEVENYQASHDMHLVKRDPDGYLLKDVEFTLYSASGDVIEAKETDENGEISFTDLEAGDYYVQETKSLNGFELDETKHEFTITGEDRDAIDLGTIVNQYKETSVELEKIWQDPTGQDLRPDKVTVNLFRNGDFLEEYEIKEVAGWKLTVDGLRAEDGNGDPYKYSITEHEVPGYTPSFDDSGLKVTNTRAENRDITMTKTWIDKDNEHRRPESVTVELSRSVNGGEEETVGEYNLNADNDWKETQKNLPMFDNNGEVYNYVVEEKELNYPDLIQPGSEPAEYETTVDGFDITNKIIGKTSVYGEKEWFDDGDVDNRPESITINLYKNGEKIDDQVVKLNDVGRWTYEFDDLERFDENGRAYHYTVDEDPIFGYRTTFSTTTPIGSSPMRYNIQNTRVGNTSLSGQKIWLDGDDESNRPESITVNVLQDDEEFKTQTVTADNNWTYEFIGMPKYDNIGKAYEYTVEEVLIDGYETSYDGNNIVNTLAEDIDIPVEKIWKGEIGEEVTVRLVADKDIVEEITLNKDSNWKHTFEGLPKYDSKGFEIDYTVEEDEFFGYITEITGDVEEGFKVTNTRSGKTEIAVQKEWLGAISDEVTINLLANGKKVDNIILDGEEDWFHLFTGLEAFDTEGVPIEYAVEEEELEGFTAIYDGNTHDGFVITNVRSGETSVDVTKTWKDEDDTDRPDSITINLKANDVVTNEYKVTSEDNWKLTIKNLPKYDENGEEITYTISEQDVPGYASEVDGYDLVNTRSETKDIELTKTWVEKNDKFRPDSIEVELFRSIEDGEKEKVDTYILTEEDNWKLVIKDLDSFDENGKAYTYEISETPVKEYNTKIDGFDITNTQKTYAIGDYTWIDENKDGIQDDNEPVLPGVKVELFDEDGKKVAETTTDKNGRYIFDELPAGKYKVKFTLTKKQAKKYEFTQQHAGKDDAVDSNADPKTGWTIDIELNDENSYLTKDYTDQDFKATEGIDPTWDAGVILKDIPEDPKDPEKPEEPEEPEEPEKPSKPEESDKGEKETSKDDTNLPKTGETTFVWLAISLILIGLGLAFVKEARKEE